MSAWPAERAIGADRGGDRRVASSDRMFNQGRIHEALAAARRVHRGNYSWIRPVEDRQGAAQTFTVFDRAQQ